MPRGSVVPFGTRSPATARYRVQLSTSMSATLLELLVRQGEVFPEMHVTTYLQKSPVFGGNPQVRTKKQHTRFSFFC